MVVLLLVVWFVFVNQFGLGQMKRIFYLEKDKVESLVGHLQSKWGLKY